MPAYECTTYEKRNALKKFQAHFKSSIILYIHKVIFFIKIRFMLDIFLFKLTISYLLFIIFTLCSIICMRIRAC